MCKSLASVTTASASDDTGAAYTFGTSRKAAHIKVVLSCYDANGSGCAFTTYCTEPASPDLECIPSTVYSEPILVSYQGTSYLRYYSTDNSGNNDTLKSQTIIIAGADSNVTTDNQTNNTTNINVTTACKEIGTACTVNADCCNGNCEGSACKSLASVTTACKNESASCVSSTDCCSGTCSDGKCVTANISSTQQTKVDNTRLFIMIGAAILLIATVIAFFLGARPKGAKPPQTPAQPPSTPPPTNSI